MIAKLIALFAGILIGIMICFIIFINNSAPANAVTTKTYSVHLASYYRMTDAITGWNKLVKKHSNYLSMLTPRVSIVVVKKKTYFRLKAGKFPSKIMADRFCNTLIGQGIYCSVTRTNGKKILGY